MREFKVIFVDPSWGEETIPADNYQISDIWLTFWAEEEVIYQIRAAMVRSIRVAELVPA